NFARAELSPDEVREHLRRRKEIWDKRQAERKQDAEENNGARCAINRGRGRPKAFAAETAAAVGKSKSQINRQLAKAETAGKVETPQKRKRRTHVEIGRDKYWINYLGVVLAIAAGEPPSDAALDLLTAKERTDAIETLETAATVIGALLDRLRARG